MSEQWNDTKFINRQSFIELSARERAEILFDTGTARESRDSLLS